MRASVIVRVIVSGATRLVLTSTRTGSGPLDRVGTGPVGTNRHGIVRPPGTPHDGLRTGRRNLPVADRPANAGRGSRTRYSRTLSRTRRAMLSVAVTAERWPANVRTCERFETPGFDQHTSLVGPN